MTVTFRPAGPDDDEFLYQLYCTTRRKEIEAMGLEPAQQEMFLRMQFMAQNMAYKAEFPEPIHNIILYEGRPAGRVMTMRQEKEDRYIDLALLPEYRKLGIGTQIIKDLLDESARAGLTARLHVLKSNRAAQLYERLGFSTVDDDGINYIMVWSPRSGEVEG